jgi:hypothetical protein
MSVNDNDSIVNTKSGALSVIAICLIALIALTLYKHWALLTEPARPLFVFEKEPYGVEYPIGFFIGGLGMTGILSFVWWAFRRFQWSRASGPLLLWTVLTFLFSIAHLSIL